MLKPNTVQNTRIGTTGNTPDKGPDSPNSRAPKPSWNTSTTAPNAAATETRFKSTAFTGMSAEPNPAHSATSVPATTRATTPGKRPPTASS